MLFWVAVDDQPGLLNRVAFAIGSPRLAALLVLQNHVPNLPIGLHNRRVDRLPNLHFGGQQEFSDALV